MLDLKRRIASKIYVDLNRDYRNTILLAGSGRSGTTWLSQIINYNNEYRYMFEPFHSKNVKCFMDYNNRHYIRPDKNDDELNNIVKKILSGNIRNLWTDHYNKKFISRKRLIKDIRINLMLKWIRNNFPKLPIVFMMRHPCAVVNSRLRLGWGNPIAELLTQNNLYEDYLKKYKTVINNADTKFERHLIFWCLENYIPLKLLNDNDDLYIIFYENLCIYPEQEIKNLFNYLNINYNEEVQKKVVQSSKMSRKGSAINTGNNLLSNWKKDINNEQIEKFLKIVEVFGLNKIYSEDIMPHNQSNILKLYK
ncbi:MAG: sulfotransferase [bacterium]